MFTNYQPYSMYAHMHNLNLGSAYERKHVMFVILGWLIHLMQ